MQHLQEKTLLFSEIKIQLFNYHLAGNKVFIVHIVPGTQVPGIFKECFL
jgi:hypothetical protein